MMFILIIVTVIITANLFPTLNSALSSLANNSSTASVLVTIVPIVLVMGLLITIVTVAFSKLGGKGKRV